MDMSFLTGKKKKIQEEPKQTIPTNQLFEAPPIVDAPQVQESNSELPVQEHSSNEPIDEEQNKIQSEPLQSFSTNQSKLQDIPNRLPKLPGATTQTPDRSFDLPKYENQIPMFNELSIEMEELPILEVQDSHDRIREHGPQKPVYLRTDYYSNILSNIDGMKSQVSNSSELIYGLKNLKKNVQVEHSNYKDLLEDIQRKLIYVDRVIFKS